MSARLRTSQDAVPFIAAVAPTPSVSPGFVCLGDDRVRAKCREPSLPPSEWLVSSGS